MGKREEGRWNVNNGAMVNACGGGREISGGDGVGQGTAATRDVSRLAHHISATVQNIMFQLLSQEIASLD